MSLNRTSRSQWWGFRAVRKLQTPSPLPRDCDVVRTHHAHSSRCRKFDGNLNHPNGTTKRARKPSLCYCVSNSVQFSAHISTALTGTEKVKDVICHVHPANEAVWRGSEPQCEHSARGGGTGGKQGGKGEAGCKTTQYSVTIPQGREENIKYMTSLNLQGQ